MCRQINKKIIIIRQNVWTWKIFSRASVAICFLRDFKVNLRNICRTCFLYVDKKVWWLGVLLMYARRRRTWCQFSGLLYNLKLVSWISSSTNNCVRRDAALAFFYSKHWALTFMARTIILLYRKAMRDMSKIFYILPQLFCYRL